MSEPLVSLRDVCVHFSDRSGLVGRLLRHKHGAVYAVNDVSIDIRRGEIVGLVGESGSGKTTLGRTTVGLQRPSSGDVIFDGQDVGRASRRELRGLRRRMQMIFQDPHASLSPRFRISRLLDEPFRIHRIPRDRRTPSEALLETVELAPEIALRYPHQLSGGQARRVGIARALALNPEFVVADEPTSGLDASAAAAILGLMNGLRERLGLSYLLITHDLNVVGYLADTIVVMYLGHPVEIGPAEQIFDRPAHPYTQALLAASPEPGRLRERTLLLPGEIPESARPAFRVPFPHTLRIRTRAFFH